MSLTDLLLIIRNDEGKISKHIDIMFDERGVGIACDEDEEMTDHETNYALAVAFLHAGAQIKGLVLEPMDPALAGHQLYSAFHKSYDGLKNIKEMTEDEFSQYMVDHDL